MISCTGNDGVSTVTIFPCESPILVNVNIVSQEFSINVNTTEDHSEPIGFASSFNIELEQITGGIRFGVSGDSLQKFAA